MITCVSLLAFMGCQGCGSCSSAPHRDEMGAADGGRGPNAAGRLGLGAAGEHQAGEQHCMGMGLLCSKMEC